MFRLCFVYLPSYVFVRANFCLYSVFWFRLDPEMLHRIHSTFAPPVTLFMFHLCSSLVPLHTFCFHVRSVYSVNSSSVYSVNGSGYVPSEVPPEGVWCQAVQIDFWKPSSPLLDSMAIIIVGSGHLHSFQKKLDPLPLPANQTLRLHSFCTERPKKAEMSIFCNNMIGNNVVFCLYFFCQYDRH